MKTKIILLGVTILLMLIAFSIWFTIPKQQEKTLQGIFYQLGHEEEIREATIAINGKIRRSLFGKMSFEGIFDILDEELPIPKGDRDITIKFNEEGRGEIVYAGYRDGKPYTYGYGSIFANHDLTKITILIGSWNAENGYMITAPAENYNEAIDISNELMEHFINHPL